MYNNYTLLYAINNFITFIFLINFANCSRIYVSNAYLSNYRVDDIKRYVDLARVNPATFAKIYLLRNWNVKL